MERALCPVLIGREPELTALEDAVLAANRGDGQIVLLAGEAGLGKTRLANELQRRALKIGMTVLWGGCSEAELALPYLPFLEAIGNYLATSDLERVRERLGRVGLELAHLFPQLEARAGLSEQGDLTQAKLRLFEAVIALLRIPADTKGVLVVLEDLHWSDASTRELLDYMTRRLAGMRAMILGTYRSDELHRKHPLAPLIQGWRRTKAADVVELQPLAPDEIAGMVSAIFDEKEITPEFTEFLYGRTEGNPFVLEELLKAALDRGDIYRGPEKWERKALTELRLPQTVKDTILLRVERLSPEQAEILQTAAVLGPAFSYHALVALSGKDEAVVQTALHASIQQQLMEEEPNGGGRYRFRHALTRESIYEDMIAPRREQLHGRAADMLTGQPGTAPMDIAYHLFAANRWRDAIPMGIKAAEDAERNAAFREAAALYERMLPHVTDDLTRGQLLCRVGNAYNQAIDAGRAQRYLEQGIVLLERRAQHREAARYRLVLGRCHWERAQPDAAKAEYERARATLEVDGPSEDLANAYIRLAGLHLFENEYQECHAMAKRAFDVAEAAKADSARIWAGVFLGAALTGLGRPDEGFAYLDASHREGIARGLYWIARNALYNATVERCTALRAREALDRIGLFADLRVSGRPTVHELFGQAMVWFYLGYPERCRGFLNQALALARETETSIVEGWVLRDLAAMTIALGRAEAALAILPPRERLPELQDQIRWVIDAMRVQLDGGKLVDALGTAEIVLRGERWGARHEASMVFDAAVEVLVRGAQLDKAEQLVARTRGGEPESDPYQDRMEGRLALAKGDLESARLRLRAAAEVFERVSYGLEEMRTRRALAEAYLASGDRANAETELRKAVERADERGAVFEGQRARDQLAAIGIEISAADIAPGAPVETEERLVTLLFLDIRGYTEMSSSEAPDRVTDKVASLYRWAGQEIERHHGLVEYSGDAVLATFNVSGARLDHCVHALQAAIAIRDKAAAAGLPLGAGIAVGAAVVGKLSAGSQVSTFGEVTNLASRLQTKAAAGEVLLSEEAHRRTHDWLAERGLVASQEALELKGFSTPVTAFRLTAASPARASSV